MSRLWLGTAALWLTSAACAGEAQPLRLGVTYTLEQSGAVAVLDSLHRQPIAVVVAASGQILRSAAGGDLDVVVAHAPMLEERILVAPGHVALRCPFVASRFAVVGPAADPAGVAAARTATDAFRRIAAAHSPFVSRGDSSGTHVKELGIWTAAGAIAAREPWYMESGTDQATTLRIADERHAYALADLPTWSRIAPPELRLLFADDTALTNPYTLYVISERGRAFARWALDTWRPRLTAFEARPGACA
jgi:tungstate transport system substrate-binding protein